MLTLIKFKDTWLSRNETSVFFYVYTQKGHCIEKIDLIQAYWEKKLNLI